MKSWTALDLTYCVENGLNFLNHKVQQGSALYLALEDSKRRLKDREAKLSHNNRERAPTVDVDAPYLDLIRREYRRLDQYCGQSKSCRYRYFG